MKYGQHIRILARMPVALVQGILVAAALLCSVGVCVVASHLEKPATIGQTGSVLMLVLLVLGALFTLLCYRLRK